MLNEVKIPENYNYIAAFLTMRCNLDCSFCLNKSGNTFNRTIFSEMSGSEWLEGLNRINSRPGVPLTLCGGEPFMHPDFIEIVKGIAPSLEIDVLTNLQWGKKGIDRFIENIDPERINRNSKYPPIRASYHPEQMGVGEKLIDNAKRLKNAGFNVGIYSVQFPSPETLQAITQMQFRCADSGILFRVKDFTGRFSGKDDSGEDFSITYGDYSKYPGSAFSETSRKCLCKTSELLIGTDGSVYRCHRDLYASGGSVGSIVSSQFQIEDIFRNCDNYGKCHPCDVKVKTDYRQKLGHTSVEIKDLR